MTSTCWSTPWPAQTRVPSTGVLTAVTSSNFSATGLRLGLSLMVGDSLLHAWQLNSQRHCQWQHQRSHCHANPVRHSNLSGLGRLSLMSSIPASIRVERASLLSGGVDSGPDYRHLSQSYWAFRKLLNRSRQSFSTSSSVVYDPASFRTASSIPSSRYPLSCIGRPPANVRRDGVLTGWPS